MNKLGNFDVWLDFLVELVDYKWILLVIFKFYGIFMLGIENLLFIEGYKNCKIFWLLCNFNGIMY